MTRLAFCVTAWLLSSSFQVTDSVVSQLNFEVYRGPDQVGTLSVWQRKESEKVTYTLTSDVEVEFLFTVQVSENITDVFEGGLLASSSHQRYVNGVLKVDHSVQRDGLQYVVVDQGNRRKELQDEIEASVVSIYFQEPADDQWVYSQNFRRMLRIQKVGDHRYSIELPNGTSTTFFYEDDRLTKVESNSYVGTVKFVNVDR